MKKFIFIIFGFLFFSGTMPTQNTPSGYEIAKEVFASTKRIKALTYNMQKTERIDGKLINQTSFVKLNRNPFKVYTRQEHPNNGLEVLYVEGENGNKALINPTGFPWVNVRLDPYGATMRKDQHHTILDSGYDHVISILEHLFDKYGKEKVSSMVQNKGVTTMDGRTCWIIEFNNPDFKYELYTVGQGENIHTIAKDKKLSGYMILEINKEIKDYEAVTAGQIIKIPSDYSPKLVLVIDKQRMIPLSMSIYDEKGLYEQYAYSNITINPTITPTEFTVAYEGYSF